MALGAHISDSAEVGSYIVVEDDEAKYLADFIKRPLKSA